MQKIGMKTAVIERLAIREVVGAEGDVGIVLVSRPVLAGTLLTSLSVKVPSGSIDSQRADDDASADGESGFGDAFTDEGKAMNVHSE